MSSKKESSLLAFIIFLCLLLVIFLYVTLTNSQRIHQLECDLGSRDDCVTAPILTTYSNRISELNSTIDRESFLRQISNTDNNIAKLAVAQNPKILNSLEKFTMFSNYIQIMKDKNCSVSDAQSSLSIDSSENGKIIGLTMNFWNSTRDNIGYLSIGETQVDISITSKDCSLNLVYDIPTNKTTVM